MMLELEDAVKVARRYMIDRGYHFDDEEDGVILTQEMEKKCYKEEGWVRTLHDLVDNINPKVICLQIESDCLVEWCEHLRLEFLLRLKMESKKHGIHTED
jgi:hypothetical protein